MAHFEKSQYLFLMYGLDGPVALQRIPSVRARNTFLGPKSSTPTIYIPKPPGPQSASMGVGGRFQLKG